MTVDCALTKPFKPMRNITIRVQSTTEVHVQYNQSIEYCYETSVDHQRTSICEVQSEYR